MLQLASPSPGLPCFDHHYLGLIEIPFTSVHPQCATWPVDHKDALHFVTSKDGCKPQFPIGLSASLQGLGLPQIHIKQWIGQVQQILMHGAINTTTGSLLCISLEQVQLKMVISIPFLEASYDHYGFLLTDMWWWLVWELLWWFQICLTYPGQSVPIPRQHNNAFIVKVLVGQMILS